MFDTSSYTDRATYETWILVWFLWRMWSNERFESLQWNHLKKFELKSMIALLISIGLPVQLTFDISWATMGYDEGFIVLPEALPLVPANLTAARHLIMETPSELWSPYNKELRQIMQYLLCFSFALLTGTLFLVQAFWSHLTTQWGKKRFTTSTEFKLYIIFSIANFIIYPSILRAVSDDPIRSESAPQLAFSCTLIIVLFLSFRNNQKLQSLYPVVQRGPRAVETLMRLEYFVEMNKYLSFGVATITVSFMILSIDAIAGPNLVLKRSWTDFLISSFNFGALILWIVMILVIFPPNFYLIGMRSRLSMSGDPQAPPLSTRISTTSQAPSTYNQNSQETSSLNMNSTSPPGGFTPESKLLEKMPENEILEEKVVLSVHAMLEQQEKHMQQFRVNMNKTPPQSRTQSPPPVSQSSQLQQYLKSKQSSFKQPSISEPSRQSRETVRMSIASVQSSDLSLHRSARSQKTLSSASYVYI